MRGREGAWRGEKGGGTNQIFQNSTTNLDLSRRRSGYNPSDSGEGYGTILIKARSDGGDPSLPVSMMVSTTTNRQPGTVIFNGLGE